MVHKSKHQDKNKKKLADKTRGKNSEKTHPQLELVVKGDTDGCEEAVCQVIADKKFVNIPLTILHKGVGDISKNDILTAATGSKLIIGFNVNVLPRLESFCREQGVEIRLYSTIYKLQEDIDKIVKSLGPQETREEITGTGQVIALFKSTRKGIIMGCEVKQGILKIGDSFRLITGMGPIYSGTIQSLHIEKDAVNKATTGQKVGIKIENFQKAKIGDIIESYKLIIPAKSFSWKPSGKILKF